MAEIRDIGSLIGYLEGGELSDEIRKDTRELVAYLHEHAGPKGKAKGTLTLTIGFDVQGSSLTIVADVATKKPKKARGSTTVFCDHDGRLLTGHPRQEDLPLGPRAVKEK